eukprot:SAG31_NODE_32_length_32319_cov_28.042681_15_plen_135_part_00
MILQRSSTVWLLSKSHGSLTVVVLGVVGVLAAAAPADSSARALSISFLSSDIEKQTTVIQSIVAARMQACSEHNDVTCDHTRGCLEVDRPFFFALNLNPVLDCHVLSKHLVQHVGDRLAILTKDSLHVHTQVLS